MTQVSIDEFRKVAEQSGLADVSSQEFDDHVREKPWSVRTSIQRIKNARRQPGGEVKEKGVIIGYPLGGRDFTYVGIQPEQSKSQFITLLADNGELKELTNWGEYKGVHGRKTEYEYDITEKEGQDKIFRNMNVRSTRVFDDKISLAKLKKIAKDVDEITKDNQYELVAVKGTIAYKWEEAVVWGNEYGQKEGLYPINYNDSPCLNFQIWGEINSLRCRIPPTHYAKPLIVFDDFVEMLEFNPSLEEYSASFTGRNVIVVGHIRSFNEGYEDKNFLAMDTTAIFELPNDEVESKETLEPIPKLPTPPSQPKASEDAKERLEQLKIEVAQAYKTIGDSITPQAVREMGFCMGVNDTIIEKIIEKIKGKTEYEQPKHKQSTNPELSIVEQDVLSYIAEKESSCRYGVPIEAITDGIKMDIKNIENVVNNLQKKKKIAEQMPLRFVTVGGD